MLSDVDKLDKDSVELGVSVYGVEVILHMEFSDFFMIFHLNRPDSSIKPNDTCLEWEQK